MGHGKQILHAAVSQFPGSQLVAQREHHKGGVIGQKAEGLAQFSGIVSEAFRGFKGGFRVPVAEFRL